MATSDPCANAPLTPPEEIELSLTPRKKRGRQKLEHNEKKGTYSNACNQVVKQLNLFPLNNVSFTVNGTMFQMLLY